MQAQLTQSSSNLTLMQEGKEEATQGKPTGCPCPDTGASALSIGAMTLTFGLCLGLLWALQD